jgi:hypothetical protein
MIRPAEIGLAHGDDRNCLIRLTERDLLSDTVKGL